MKTLLSNISLILAIALMSVLISLAASLSTWQWHWFGRAGSIVTICGVFLTIRPLIRLGLKEWIKMQQMIDGGTWDEPTDADKEANRQSTLDYRASQIGSVLIILGAIIWGYGDLIGVYYNRCI